MRTDSAGSKTKKIHVFQKYVWFSKEDFFCMLRSEVYFSCYPLCHSSHMLSHNFLLSLSGVTWDISSSHLSNSTVARLHCSPNISLLFFFKYDSLSAFSIFIDIQYIAAVMLPLHLPINSLRRMASFIISLAFWVSAESSVTTPVFHLHWGDLSHCCSAQIPLSQKTHPVKSKCQSFSKKT